MRALKSVLVMAGRLKRAHPDLEEDIVLIRAMRDSNIPKFLQSDVELFEDIVSDLFPNIHLPDQACLHTHGCCFKSLFLFLVLWTAGVYYQSRSKREQAKGIGCCRQQISSAL